MVKLEIIENLQEALNVQETINLISKAEKELVGKVYNDIISSNISNDELIEKYELFYLREICKIDDILSFKNIEIIRSLLISRLSELSVGLYYVISTILLLEHSLVGSARMLLKTLSENYNTENITADVYEILKELPNEEK
ncbi:MAG: hypothetical protein UFP03_06210 [Paludibacteraceae bacterium]|nr:hypothetical protein [Paludibacteraceae bacterium]